MMRVGDKIIQRRVALALAHLCSPHDQKKIFIDKNGTLLPKHSQCMFHVPLHLNFVQHNSWIHLQLRCPTYCISCRTAYSLGAPGIN